MWCPQRQFYQHRLQNLAVFLRYVRTGPGSDTDGTDGIELLEKAIEEFETALEIFTFEDFPQKWASLQANMGTTYKELARRISNQTTNDKLKNAIVFFKGALAIQDDFEPNTEWANSNQNLCNTLSTLAMRVKGVEGVGLLQEADRAAQRAHSFYTIEDYPFQFIGLIRDRANLAKDMGLILGGDKGLKLMKQAINSYGVALDNYSDWNFPIEWAKTHWGLAMALYHLAELDQKNEQEHLVQSISSCNKALSIFGKNPDGFFRTIVEGIRSDAQAKLDGLNPS